MISVAMGDPYRAHITRYVAGGDTGAADLVALFFRRVAGLGESLGLIATNTIAQGATRKVGLAPLVAAGQGAIFRAVTSVRWPGRDAVYVAKVWWTRREWLTAANLDERPVERIESDFYPSGRTHGEPRSLPSHDEQASDGQALTGDGFILDKAARAELLAADANSERVVFAFITGRDLNQSPTHRSDRWVIDFGDRTLAQAAKFGAALAIVERDVRPQRVKKRSKPVREQWWKHSGQRARLRARLDRLERTVAISRVSHAAVPVMVPTGPVFSSAVVLFPWADYAVLGVLTSTLHRVWVDRYASTLKADTRYSPASCFATFPFPGRLPATPNPAADCLEADGSSTPDDIATIRRLGSELQRWRADQFIAANQGIAAFYNRYHDPAQTDSVTDELRDRHIELDHAVAAAYGWSDLDLGHGFYSTSFGRYFTVSTDARFELLMRLLELNFAQTGQPRG